MGHAEVAVLKLSPVAAAHAARGLADLPLSLVSDPLPAGACVRLCQPSGAPVGLGLVDPDNACLRVMAAADEGFEALDEVYWRARTARALAARQDFGIPAATEAYRLLNGAGDDVPGFSAELFGSWAVVWVASEALLAAGRALARALMEVAGARGVVVKVRARGGAARGRPVQLVEGGEPPPALLVREGVLQAEVHLLAGTNVGLFVDMREHRQAFGRLAQGRRVLNAFSYTGTLSVAAALGGAAAVTSVDLSSGVQRWARDNFAANGLDPGDPRWRFETDAVPRYVERALAAGERYGLVAIDPPSYSAARGAPFAIERDYPALVARAAGLVARDGWLWLACSARRVGLAAIARQGLETAGRRAQLATAGGLPPDFPTRPGDAEARALQVHAYRLA